MSIQQVQYIGLNSMRWVRLNYILTLRKLEDDCEALANFCLLLFLRESKIFLRKSLLALLTVSTWRSYRFGFQGI